MSRATQTNFSAVGFYTSPLVAPLHILPVSPLGRAMLNTIVVQRVDGIREPRLFALARFLFERDVQIMQRAAEGSSMRIM